MVEIRKDLVISQIKKEDLNSVHTAIHSMWYQVLLGKRDDWTIAEMYRFHKDLVWEMITENIQHVANVDNLDTLQPLSEEVGDDDSHLETERKLAKITDYELEELAENTQELFVVKKGAKKWCVTHSDGKIIKCFPSKEQAEKMHKAIIISKIRRGVMSEYGDPYVLSAQGISKGYVPEKGVSALPKEWEDKIPKELRWWKRGLTGPKAIAVLKEIRKYILKTLEDKSPNNLKEIKDKEVKFALKRKWWKGQEVKLPVEHWEIRIDSPKFPFFKLAKNPLTSNKGISAVKLMGRKSEVMFEGSISPGEEGNPSKKIPAIINILDSSHCSILEDSKNIMYIEFKGSKLKGSWVFKRIDPESNIWVFSEGKSPKAKMEMWGEPVSESESKTISFLHANGIGATSISKFLGRPVRRIYKVLE